MDTTPPEILDRVFRLACTDDGSTGRALSAVSSRIRSISTPYKYYSLHVSGARHITRFALFLAKHHPPVQYLKLACAGPGGMRGQARSEEVGTICTNVDTIFHVLASKLKGLYLIAIGAPLKLDSFTFPFLETLYLRDNLYDISISLAQMYFPALKRADISCDTSMAHGHVFTFAGSRLPSLTHFGCCSHGQGGMWSMLSMLSDHGKSSRVSPSENMVGINNFLALDVLQIRAPSAKLPELFSFVEGFDRIERFPMLTIKVHDSSESVKLIKEWRYIVEGGEGFDPSGSVAY